MKNLSIISVLCLIANMVVAQDTVFYNQPVAIYIEGGGYLAYKDKHLGINLGWDKFPSFDWLIKDKARLAR
ncbi:hypothetical protein LZD49_30670 [Dyadobacter sp. CY261]|uniref:hypothetical protein n=1 Tax=Dyadobacter sp. CY261 TaxID=2907203 RepID=UPI001F3701A9|nr:hypothetical protein [Dyadobacter sp. CY261]MCF0074889.1 hypothetical protein [Dyadobacter sp. CY261]